MLLAYLSSKEKTPDDLPHYNTHIKVCFVTHLYLR